jgi:molybdopterin converting factor small subunit
VAEASASEVLVRYFAAAAEAAGTEEELLPAVPTVGALRAVLVELHGDAMARVLASGSFLVDGVVSRDDARALGSRVDVLPPFAGG